MLRIDCAARNESQNLSVGLLGLLLFVNTHFSCPVACLLLRSEYRRGTLRRKQRAQEICSGHTPNTSRFLYFGNHLVSQPWI